MARSSVLLSGVLLLVLAHCTVRHIEIPVSTGLPEQVHARPSMNFHRDAKVGVFRFDAPAHAPRAGFEAATILRRMLQEKGIFWHVSEEFGFADLSIEAQLEIAQEKGLDLIVCGGVTDHFTGSLLLESRVQERMTAVNVANRQIVWEATVATVGKPLPQSDYIFFRTRGREAPSPAALMHVNADKLCNLFLWVSPNLNLSLVEGAHKYLAERRYEKAKENLNRALAEAPDNLFARYGLGILHELIGDKEEAMSNYRQIVDYRPHLMVTEPLVPEKTQRSLFDLAQERLHRVTAGGE